MSRLALLAACSGLLTGAAFAEPLRDTKPLTREGDLAAQMVEGIDKYLTRALKGSVEKRKDLWKPDYSSPEAYAKSVRPNRDRLRKALGVVDERVPFKDLEYVGGPNTPSLVAETKRYKVYAVRWPVLPGVDAEGLLLEPTNKPKLNVVALPDADWPPEVIAGLRGAIPDESLFPGVDPDAWKVLKATFWNQGQFARKMAENGCRVLVPTLIDRKDTHSGNPKLGKLTNQPHREFVYRMAYEMGRHVIGYEVQKVLAAVDWFCREKGHAPVYVHGYGEGATVAFYSAALDDRIHSAVIGAYFAPREEVWREPIYRNVWGLVREFGDAEVAAHLICPIPKVPDGKRKPIRRLGLENSWRPVVTGPPAPREGRGGAAPGRLGQIGTTFQLEFDRLEKLLDSVPHQPPLFESIGGDKPLMVTSSFVFENLFGTDKLDGPPPADLRKDFDPDARHKRQFDQLVAFTQKLMRDSEDRRKETFWDKLDLSSLEKYQASTNPFREQFWEEVIGKLPAPTEPMNPRSRQVYDEPKWKGYEVTLDLYPDVFAQGILLLPKDLKAGEKRPVVVCQHGLEGTPRSCIDAEEKRRVYNRFAPKLAELGYVVYCPQNPYTGKDAFRVLQRKANPLGLSLFSFIVRQHERTLEWLGKLPGVDPERIAFYGLSYGGKTAMRVPAILPGYCLSICSADFNEWIRKNVSVDFKASYMFSMEYEMPEFNLGHTFNYAEMAALIAPRPFMVERGHDDGVGIDEWVAHEYAKVRRLYTRLKIPDRTEIEFFDGGHEINARGTFAFLKKHLRYP